jgi:hypothetical protein
MTERSAPSPNKKKKSDVSIWMALIIVGCGVIYASSVAIGLMPSRSSVFRSSHQDTASAPASRPAEKPVASVVVPAPSIPDQNQQLSSDIAQQKEMITLDSASVRNLIPQPPAAPPLDPELRPKNEWAAQEPSAPETTSGLPSVSKPTQKADLSVPKDAASPKPSVSSIAPAPSPRARTPTAPGDYAQDTGTATAQKRRPPSQSAQKMWYK